MLNSLAAYILGGVSTVAPVCDEDVHMRFTAVEADDWLLVDKEIDPLTDSDGEQRSSPPLPGLVNARIRRVSAHLLTRTASPSPNRTTTRMEESWFLTPPPCFTSQGPCVLETSPLENLLIEHPSMSVYQHSSHYSMLESLDSDGNTSSSSMSEAPSIIIQATVPNNGASRGMQGRGYRTNSLNRQQQKQQKEERKSIKKVQKSRQVLKRSALERTNKAREVNARNAQRRRADHAHAQKNSRANNNRKCC